MSKNVKLVTLSVAVVAGLLVAYWGGVSNRLNRRADRIHRTSHTRYASTGANHTAASQR